MRKWESKKVEKQKRKIHLFLIFFYTIKVKNSHCSVRNVLHHPQYIVIFHKVEPLAYKLQGTWKHAINTLSLILLLFKRTINKWKVCTWKKTTSKLNWNFQWYEKHKKNISKKQN